MATKPPKEDDPESKPWNASDSDRADLDQILANHRHRRWLGGLLFRWAKWITAVALGATVVWDWVARIIKQAGSP